MSITETIQQQFGISADEAALVNDLSKHAARKALETIKTAALTVPSHLVGAVLQNAMVNLFIHSAHFNLTVGDSLMKQRLIQVIEDLHAKG